MAPIEVALAWGALTSLDADKGLWANVTAARASDSVAIVKAFRFMGEFREALKSRRLGLAPSALLRVGATILRHEYQRRRERSFSELRIDDVAKFKLGALSLVMMENKFASGYLNGEHVLFWR